MRMAVFHFSYVLQYELFHSYQRYESYGSYQRNSGFVILVLLTLLTLLVVVLNCFQPSCVMSYTVHNKEHSRPAILMFLTFLTFLMFVF
jgi:hypothetical protein